MILPIRRGLSVLMSMSAARFFVASLALLLASVSSPVFAACDQYAPAVLNTLANQYYYEIASASRSNGVNPNLIKAVITAESCFRQQAVSNKGAGGLMQLMPATARRFGVSNRFDTTENIHGGARYLKFLLNRYGGSIPHAVAAYNAGEGRVDVYGTGVPFRETQDYTRRVLNAYGKLSGGQGRAGVQQAKPQWGFVGGKRMYSAQGGRPVLVSYHHQAKRPQITFHAAPRKAAAAPKKKAEEIWGMGF
jgi:soluble lytic murein transglycosylase-like protein